jgi:UDP-N-acetylmuramate--alanine ligase
MFRKLIDHTSGFIISGNDDQNLVSHSLLSPFGFSIEAPSKYQAHDIAFKPFKTVFTLNGQRFDLPLPGRFNLYNALACIACLAELGISEKDIAGALSEFSGIERRFDIHLQNDRYLVIDDYAHNPHKIQNLMQAIQKTDGTVCYIFQPHGYGPTRLMKSGYADVFSRNLRKKDHLILLPIFYAGGTATRDISSNDIADEVIASGRSAEVMERRSDLFKLLGRWESYVVFGARDDSLSDLARMIADRLQQ